MQFTGAALISFLECSLIRCHIKENVSRESYGNEFWHWDNKCHPKSPKMRSLFESYKVSLAFFEKPSKLQAVVTFFIPWPHLGIKSHRDTLLCFWFLLCCCAYWTTVKGSIDCPWSCNEKNKTKKKPQQQQKRQGVDHVNNLRKKENQYLNDLKYWFIIKS